MRKVQSSLIHTVYKLQMCFHKYIYEFIQIPNAHMYYVTLLNSPHRMYVKDTTIHTKVNTQLLRF